MTPRDPKFDPASITAPLPITVIVPTRNEEANIRRCLVSARYAERRVVVDSGSTDQTCTIARELGCEVVNFAYRGGYPKKRQWALHHLNIQTPWTLLLDADEVVPDALWHEIAEAVRAPDAPEGFLIEKGYHFLGKRFRFGGFSFSAVLLFKTGRARFERPKFADDKLDMEVHERVLVDGRIQPLDTPLIHEDFKGLEAYIAKHNFYSTWEARVRHDFLTTGGWGAESIRPDLFGNTQERRRFLKAIAIRVPLEPQLWFIYHYLLRLGFLEGRRGFIASTIRARYISEARSKLYELRLADEVRARVDAAPGNQTPASPRAAENKL